MMLVQKARAIPASKLLLEQGCVCVWGGGGAGSVAQLLQADCTVAWTAQLDNGTKSCSCCQQQVQVQAR